MRYRITSLIFCASLIVAANLSSEEPVYLIKHFGAENSPNTPCDVDEECDTAPWYVKHKTYEELEEEDVGSQLQQDTTWPAEREDFSDTLLR